MASALAACQQPVDMHSPCARITTADATARHLHTARSPRLMKGLPRLSWGGVAVRSGRYAITPFFCQLSNFGVDTLASIKPETPCSEHFTIKNYE